MFYVGLFTMLIKMQKFTWNPSNHVLNIMLFQIFIFCKSKKITKEGLISYYKTNGITCFLKHVDGDHSIIFKILKKRLTMQWKEIQIDNLQKRSKCFQFFHFRFFCSKRSFQKNDVEQKMFVYEGPCTFNHQKPLAFTIYGKCMVKVFSITYLSLCWISLKTFFFTQCFI
jgi:hypothetical protein